MSGWHEQEFRERLRALVKQYTERKAGRGKVGPPANDVTIDAKVILFPRAPRLPMHR